MKKYRIALVIILAVVFMVGVIAQISFMKNLNDSDVSQKDISQEDEEEYIPSGSFIADFVLTEQEVYRINNNSNLLGCELLGEAPEGAITAISNSIRSDTQDEYICFPYRGEHLITVIKLVSEDADILGISVGDTIESAEAVLLEDGYSRQESAPDNYHIYRMIFVSISLKYDEDNVIVEMGISVNDPFEENIDY